jgi:uncharacterized membrane protein YfcA
MTSWLLLGLAGFGAGAVNAIAGGGSLLSFPALLLTGLPAIAANATNAVAIWPGSLSSVWAYRRQLAEQRRPAWILAWPSLLGGLVGSYILLHSSEQLFRAIVPWLILFACGLLALQAPVARLLAGRMTLANARVAWPLWLAQLCISIYGGYFGAGMGILMLAAMAILMPGSLQHANALKVLFALLINGVAALYFLAMGTVQLPQASLMAVTALAGGYAGARLALVLPAAWMRALVVVYGVAIAARLLMTG